jgi:hypothetical protein
VFYAAFYTIHAWIRRDDEFVAVVELLGERFAEPLDRSIQKINKKQQNREICIN